MNTQRSLGEDRSLAKWYKNKINVRTKIRSGFDQVRSSLQDLHQPFSSWRGIILVVQGISHLWHLYRVNVYLSPVQSTLYLQQLLPLPVFPVKGQLSWMNISSPKLTWLQMKGSVFIIVLFTLKYLMCCMSNKHSVRFHFTFFFLVYVNYSFHMFWFFFIKHIISLWI